MLSFLYLKKPIKTWLLLLWSLQLVAFIWACYSGHILTKDSLEYIAAAKHFWNEGFIYAGPSDSFDFRLLSKRPPLYPILLSFFTFGGSVLFPMLILQNLGLAWVYFFIAKHYNRVFTAAKTHWAALIAVLFTFTPIIYANMVMSDIWLIFCLLPACHYFLIYLKSKRWRKGVQALMLLLLMVFIKPVALYLLTAYVLLWVGVSIRKRQYKPLLFLFVPVFAIGGWMIRNAVWTSVPHYSSIYNINLSQYNARLFLASKTSFAYADSVLQPTYFVPQNRKEFAQYNALTRKIGGEIITEDLLGYLGFHLKGMLKMPLDPGRFDFSSFFYGPDDGEGFLKVDGGILEKLTWLGLHQPVVGVFWLLGLLFRLVLLLLLLLRLFHWKKFEVQQLLYLIIILYFVGVTGPLGASRFFLPALPFVFLLIIPIKSVPESS